MFQSQAGGIDVPGCYLHLTYFCGLLIPRILPRTSLLAYGRPNPPRLPLCYHLSDCQLASLYQSYTRTEANPLFSTFHHVPDLSTETIWYAAIAICRVMTVPKSYLEDSEIGRRKMIQFSIKTATNTPKPRQRGSNQSVPRPLAESFLKKVPLLLTILRRFITLR